MTVTPGNYRARATGAVLCRANSGNEQVVITFQIKDPGPFDGAEINYYGSFHPNASKYTLEALETCGFEGDNLLDLSGVVRHEVELVIQDNEYQGRTYTKVAYVNRLGAIAAKNALSDAEARVFAQRMRDNIRAAKAAKGTNSPNGRPPVSKGSPHDPPRSAGRTPPSPSSSPDDDPIPF
jgi:hypothetical protein